jgi:hypothetical protein
MGALDIALSLKLGGGGIGRDLFLSQASKSRTVTPSCCPGPRSFEAEPFARREPCRVHQQYSVLAKNFRGGSPVIARNSRTKCD